MALSMPANELDDPEIIISDYGTSFIVAQTPSPTLHTPSLYSPPEDLFNEPIIQPTAADIWTLGVNLYELLGERVLFETFAWDRDGIVTEMVNTLGQPPMRCTPVFRPLRQRLWDMGRGETEQTCQWDVAGGELRALEDFLRAMMTFEPAERPTADQLLRSQYMVK
ncbi:hypothetical protein CBS147333_2641 [Penicillium roqueforti]|nr:hypothetical protein CBS147355_4632 [Penicillium roqueforti]KAI2705602.1 hypothetical protein CBS147372_1905 [Penicillium roqueforti]KAI2727492.1 hypothetical protein CBS147354_3165 [Penicillium roqueforti]KAI3113805.1 hypothetical protein CBS147333_2641 [Penicillium roqueforti]KAI3166611.1 hypothetical protein CBS147317_2554 [Penicillium roqueforti]